MRTSRAANADASIRLGAPKDQDVPRNGSRTTLRQLMFVTLGSLMFVSLKTLLVALLHALAQLAPWLNYLIVTLSVSLLGWVYHSRVSFQRPLTRATLLRYGQQAVALKILDYGIYNGLVYGMQVDLRWAVLVTGAIVFSTRIPVYFKYVFAAPEVEDPSNLDVRERPS
ncbi:MAG: hypothetical protein ACR2QM_16825 [Longimicrobiales bacterium]